MYRAALDPGFRETLVVYVSLSFFYFGCIERWEEGQVYSLNIMLTFRQVIFCDWIILDHVIYLALGNMSENTISSPKGTAREVEPSRRRSWQIFSSFLSI